MPNFNLNKEKAINSLLFVINRLKKADLHKVLKILYFAEQKHLREYGRPIFSDTYLKMQYGPVASFVKYVIDNDIEEYKNTVKKYGKHFLKSLKKENTDYLSQSDIECLTASLNENKNLSFKELTEKSHDKAYKTAKWEISHKDIAEAGGADANILKIINEQMINASLELK